MRLFEGLRRALFPNMASQGQNIPGREGGEHACLFKARMGRGWYMVELLFDDSNGADKVSLCPVCSQRGDELLGQFLLPLQAGKLVKRIIYLSDPIDGMQIRCMGPGEFGQVSVFRLVRLRAGFARKRMMRRLTGSATGKPPGSRHGSLAGKSDDLNLFRLYNLTFMPPDEAGYQVWLGSHDQGVLSAPVLFQGDMFVGEGFTHESDITLFVAPGYRLTVKGFQVLCDAIRQNESAVLVYADEDCLDEQGRRSWPIFKPDWSLDTFLSRDYISACFVCRRAWFDQHSAVFERLGVVGALVYLLPSEPAFRIAHVPQVVFHRLPSATEPPAQQREDALEVLKSESGEGMFKPLPGLLPGTLRLQYTLPTPPPLVSLLIPTRDGLHVLRPCVESILEKTDYSPYEILILDNQSREPETLAWLAEIQHDPRVSVLPYNQPFNYSAINNFGARHARGSVIGLINNDVEVISPGWLTEMVSQACRPEIGCVGAKLYYSNGQIQHGGVILGLGHVAGHAHRFLERDADGYHGRLKLVQNYSAVTAACLLVLREIYEQVGGLEEEHLTVAYNDVDFCLRVRAAGYRNLWTPYAELYHHESISRGEDDTPEKKARYDKEVAYMWRTWRKELEHDPCYNPNLSRRREDFSLREFLL